MFKPRVLLANDDPANLLALTSLLSDRDNYEVITARSGEEALRWVLKYDDFAVILLDVSMPGMDGFETAEAIHSHPRSASVPIIFVTAQYADEIYRLKGYQRGAVDYLFTPVIPQILQTKVAVFVELAKKNLQFKHQTLELEQLNARLQEQRKQDLEHINERKQAEAALRQSREELRQLASYQERIKEDERKRIAREIHDELGQNLLALRIDVAMLHTRTATTHPKLNQKVQGVLEHIDTTMKAMRAIINNLRPIVLDLGLNAAIDWQVKEFQRRTGIACELLMPKKDLTIADGLATALFRILQETLNNVFRHARATKVTIELYTRGERLVMMVADNGIGIFPGCRRKANSFGLVGIKERVSALHGEFALDTAQDKGTSITISIPLDADVADSGAGSADVHAVTTIRERRAADGIKPIGTTTKSTDTRRRRKESPVKLKELS